MLEALIGIVSGVLGAVFSWSMYKRNIKNDGVADGQQKSDIDEILNQT